MHPWLTVHTGIGDWEGFMKAIVTERGQVTIPKRLRERLNIRPGTVLEFREEAGKLVAEKAKAAGGLDRWYGSLGRKRQTDDIIRALRGEP
jgi:AbrB family looped-hinge helix DNA binding protein